MKRKNAGFTLIELMIVIAIIGIALSLLNKGVEQYRADHANDSAPVIQFDDKQQTRVVPQ